MMYDNVCLHPNLVPLTLSSWLMPFPSSPLASLPLRSLTKRMPTASATCLAKKASGQTTPPTVAWRWFYQTHPAKETITVSWWLLQEAITRVMSHSAAIIRLSGLSTDTTEGGDCAWSFKCRYFTPLPISETSNIPRQLFVYVFIYFNTLNFIFNFRLSFPSQWPRTAEAEASVLQSSCQWDQSGGCCPVSCGPAGLQHPSLLLCN